VIDRVALEAALDDVRALVAADGGDVALASVDGTSVRLTLVLDTAECRDCVMPGSFLERVALDMLAPRVPGLTAVVVDDPRIAG
jgi:Fe-S cluster biogenesis protein NfuA